MTKELSQAELRAALQQSAVVIQKLKKELAGYHEPIAVTGMACRFPGADSPEAFWELLRQGVDRVGPAPATRWAMDAYYDPVPATPGKSYVREGAFLTQIDGFDAHFFGISPREAASMDPQHRLLLEVSWEALERAGQSPAALQNSQTGVFVGVTPNEYAQLVEETERTETYISLGNYTVFAVGRLSYVLGLQGPNLAIDAACSASLIGIHLACESLRTGSSDLALAGGVHLMLSPQGFVSMSQLQALAPDGRCKTFDAAANGFGRGEGCGMVVLKRLSDALADRDPILAVIRGSATNHDGPSSGLTVPSVTAQAALIRRALANGKVAPDAVSYVDAHGTGTSLGDPIEVRALATVFGERTTPLLIGSVKTNIGHLEEAAGVAGLIKVILSMQHQELPPHLHLRHPNPHIDWERIALRIPTAATPWPAGKKIAGVSSFGLGGSNAHVVVEEAPPLPDQPGEGAGEQERPWHLLTLSAKSEGALRALAQRYCDLLQQQPTLGLGDLCYTAYTGRSHFAHRLSLTVASRTELHAALTAYLNGAATPAIHYAVAPDYQTAPKIAFLFTGQGSQYIGMGRALYTGEPLFRSVIDRCDQVLREVLGRSLIDLLYPATAPDHNDLLTSHPCGQAANFALQCALVDLWRAWGVLPDLVLGHSLGDFAAAYCAGVLTLEEGLRLVTLRGQLMEQATGSMIAVMAAEAEVLPFIAGLTDVTIGVINGPQSVVISGGQASVALVTEQLQTAGYKTRRLAIPVAAHSPLLDPVLDAFEAAVRQVKLSPPQRPVVSSMTGQLVTQELTDPRYWRRHLRNTVRFADGVQTLHELGVGLFLEIGPKPTLVGLAEQVVDQGTRRQEEGETRRQEAQGGAASLLPVSPSSCLFLPSLRADRAEWQQMLTSLGALYGQRVKVDWQGVDRAYQRRKLLLPTYPFQRERYWLTAGGQRRKTTALRPLIDKMTRLPLHQATLFETEFSVDALPFLADHRLYEQVVSPAACQLALLLGAAALFFAQQQGLQLVDLILPQALVLPPDGARTVQALLTPVAANGSGPHSAFQLISFDPQSPEAEPPIHAQGYVTAQAPPPPLVDLAALRQCFDDSMAVDLSALYADRLINTQIDLGPSFHWLTQLWRREEEGRLVTLGQLQMPAVITDFAAYLLHPGLLDAAFHVAAAATTAAVTGAMLPFALRALHFYQSNATVQPAPMAATAAATWWCHATQVAPHRWDLVLLDSEGRVLLTINGFEMRQASVEAIRGRALWQEWLYRTAWRPHPRFGLPLAALTAPAASTLAEPAEAWLLFVDRGGVGEALAEQLRAQGVAVTLVYGGTAWEERGDDCFVIDPTHAADYQQLLAALPSVDQVVHLWSLDLPPLAAGVDLMAAAQQNCGAVLPLVQALLYQGRRLTGLWLITQNAQAVIPGDTVTGAGQAALWGMGKVIQLEHPELNCRLLDLADGVAAVEAQAEQSQLYTAQLLGTVLRATTAGNQAESALAIRTSAAGTSCYVARLTRVTDEPSRAITIARDATYLITGGLGGIGLALAQWLAEEGAGHLVLVGRSHPQAKVAAHLDALRAHGVQLTIAQCDVTDQAQVAALLAGLPAHYPLRGVIHAAGVLADGALWQQDWERFVRVLVPKVQGAWHLHELTAALPLDFFVLLSSASSLLGNNGQANHAAANAFLDAFAHYRQAHQHPALSINWGAWSEVGAAAHLVRNQQAQMAASGMGFITPAQGVAAFAALLQQAAPQAGVVPINWRTYGQHEQTATPFYAEFAEAMRPPTRPSVEAQPAPPASFRQPLAAATPAQRKGLLVAHIQETVAKILALTALPAATVGFTDLGMDSLMAIDLRRRLERSLQLTLPSTLAFEYPTAERLATQLLTESLADLLPPALPAAGHANGHGVTNDSADPAFVAHHEPDELAAEAGDPLEAKLRKLEALLKG
jgi:acyl transferase domain-containing protein/acyl carrier protein